MSYFSKRKFVFSADKTITSLLAAILCFGMSYWQWTRYIEKKGYFATLEEQATKPMSNLDPEAVSWEALYHGKVLIEGSFDFEHEMVLINRSKDDKTGVRVVTPFKLTQTNKAILVDRGFVEYTNYADKNTELYQHADETQIEGLVRPSQEKTFFLAPPTKEPKPGQWVERWLRLEVPMMAKQLPYEVLPIYVEQTNQKGPAPAFDPKEITHPGRHLNYTFQWIGFGLFSIFLALFLQFKPKDRLPSEA